MKQTFSFMLLALMMTSCFEECPDGGSIAGGEPPKRYARYCGLSSYGSFTKHGPYKEWYLGTNKLKFVGQYYKGRKTGEWICYAKNGFEVEQKWRDGKLADGPECTEKELYELSKSIREKAKGSD